MPSPTSPKQSASIPKIIWLTAIEASLGARCSNSNVQFLISTQQFACIRGMPMPISSAVARLRPGTGRQGCFRLYRGNSARPPDVCGVQQSCRHPTDESDIVSALNDLEKAIQVEPQDASAHCNRAWIWATARDDKYRDGKRAVESANKACELTGSTNPKILAVLAAAHAEAGDFKAAVKWQAQAIELAGDDESLDLSSRLELYKSGKPYRDDPTNWIRER